MEKCFCNACGRELKTKEGILQEDVLSVKKDWGYFSEKDLMVHEFIVCEKCYDAMISRFAKPVTVSEKREVMDS